MGRFTDILLRTVGLLIGLYVIQVLTMAMTPYVALENIEAHDLLLTYGHWIGNVIFGLIIYTLMRRNRVVSMPVGILSTVMPVFGGLFYLLVTLTSSD